MLASDGFMVFTISLIESINVKVRIIDLKLYFDSMIEALEIDIPDTKSLHSVLHQEYAVRQIPSAQAVLQKMNYRPQNSMWDR